MGHEVTPQQLMAALVGAEFPTDTAIIRWLSERREILRCQQRPVWLSALQAEHVID